MPESGKILINTVFFISLQTILMIEARRRRKSPPFLFIVNEYFGRHKDFF